MDELEVEQDNLRAALEWGLENDPLAALQMASALYTFWGRRVSATEGYAWVKTAMVRAEATIHLEGDAALPYLAARAKGFAGEASLALQIGDNKSARTSAEASISLARQINATKTLAYALGIGATICGFLGDANTAREWVSESRAISRQHRYDFEQAMMAGADMFLAVVTNRPVPPGVAAETIRIARASGNPYMLGMAIANVGRVARMGGHLAEAYACFEEGLTLFQKIRDKSMYTSMRSEIGHVFRQQGRNLEAAEVYRETTQTWQELGQWAAVAHELECFAFIAGTQNQGERAAKLLGAAEALRELLKSAMVPMERREYDAAVSDLRARMDEDALAKAWAEGRAMDRQQAIQFAIDLY